MINLNEIFEDLEIYPNKDEIYISTVSKEILGTPRQLIELFHLGSSYEPARYSLTRIMPDGERESLEMFEWPNNLKPFTREALWNYMRAELDKGYSELVPK